MLTRSRPESIGAWPEITTYSAPLNGALVQILIELGLADLCAPAQGRVFEASDML